MDSECRAEFAKMSGELAELRALVVQLRID